jgi:hypothetical protein
MTGIRSASAQPSSSLQLSILLELPASAEVIALTDPPPELLPTQPSVQLSALPSAIVTPALVVSADALKIVDCFPYIM